RHHVSLARPSTLNTPSPYTTLFRSEQLRQEYAALIRTRRNSPALTAGGLRWVHAEEDALVFLREHPDETALVHVARAAHERITLDRKSTRLNSSHVSISYAVFGLDI